MFVRAVEDVGPYSHSIGTHSVGAALAAARMIKPLFRATARIAPTHRLLHGSMYSAGIPSSLFPCAHKFLVMVSTISQDSCYVKCNLTSFLFFLLDISRKYQ